MTDVQNNDRPVPRGIRNNNAGNIRYNVHNKWAGQSGCDDLGFCEFTTPELGLRALWKLLMNYHTFGQCDTIAQVVNKWAPDNENNTIAYVSEVSRSMNIPADATLDFPTDIPALMRGIIIQENGYCPYSQDQLDDHFDFYPLKQ
jgi:hypothetical protein